MCELLAMSAALPTNLEFSLSLLRPRGGELCPHADGWGVAAYEDRAARLYKEPKAASSSRLFGSLRDYGITSRTILAHIRKANPPTISRSYANTHPFEREFRGRSWTFAHNGTLPGIDQEPLGPFRPVGGTDSEHAFCLLLGHLNESTMPHGDVENLDLALERITEGTAIMNRYGEANYLLSNGEYLFVHAHTYLHMLERECKIEEQTQNVVVLSTQPLTDESWSCLVPNRLTVFQRGKIIAQRVTSGAASEEAWKAQKDQAEAFKIRKTAAAEHEARMKTERDIYWECS